MASFKTPRNNFELHNTERKYLANWHGTALIVEALILLAFVAGCVTVFVKMYTYAYTTNTHDATVVSAANLATNQAERFAADPRGIEPSAIEGDYLVETVVTPEATANGTLYHATITVSAANTNEPLYNLSTARYVSAGEHHE